MKYVVRVCTMLLATFIMIALLPSSSIKRDAALPDPIPVGVTLTGMDSHDGTVVEDAGTLWMVGTRYACGYRWQDSTSPFCGFGLWHSSSGIAGPWSYDGLLFDPNGTNSTRNEQWRITCNYGGNGCFNPRLIKRWDGVWLLFFNAPADTLRGRDEAYYVMGCNGDTPSVNMCGSAAGAPHGSTRQLPMNVCNMGGDFTVFADGTTLYLACSSGLISIEQLDYWWTSGAGSATSGAVRNVAYLTNVEAPGVWKDAATGMWVMTFGDPQCGYCGGTPTSFIVSQRGLTDPAPATTPLGVWLGPTNVGWNAPASGRRGISMTSCGGQPRTVFTISGQPYQWIDTWYGDANEMNASVRFEPLIKTGEEWRKTAQGDVLVGAFRPFTCE